MAESQNHKLGSRAQDSESDCLTFFRRCPQCGKRFEIKLLEKSALEGKTVKEPRPLVAEYFSGSPDEYLELNVSAPAIIAIEKFQYAYRCNHCGHRWIETSEDEIGTEKGTMD